MEDIILTNKEAWDKVKYVAKHPMVIIPVIIGLASLIIAIIVDNKFVETLFMAISSIGLGVAINYYSFYYKDLSAFNRLNMEMKEMDKDKAIYVEKSVNAIRNLKTISDRILSHYAEKHATLDEYGRTLISDIAVVIKAFGDYHNIDTEFDADISNYKRLSSRIEDAPNVNEQEFLIYQRNNYEFMFSLYKIPAYLSATGSLTMEDTVFKSVKEPNKFTGSGGLTNEPTFKSPDNPEKG